MLSSIKKLFFISRPISWVNTAYPFAAAYLISGGTINPLFFIATLFFLIPYNLLMYGVNDVFIAMIVLGNIAAIIGLIVLTFFVVAYSLKWLRFKERPLLDSITSSIHFAGPAVYGLLLTGFYPGAWPFIIALFLWGMASHALGAIQDIIPDRKGNISSIATVFGASITLRLVIILYGAASFIVILQSLPAAIIGVAGLMYIINVVPYLGISDKTSMKINKAWRRFIWLNMATGFR